jgi:acyl-CoA synthetase (AMP-forming)/AMP-acid ligase II/thioesterase domain-containing protein
MGIPPIPNHVTSLHGLLRTQVECQPEAVAIRAPGRTSLTYDGLWAQLDEVLGALNTLGIGRQDRVAIVLPNGPEMATAFLGVAAGASAAPLNPGYRTNEFEFYLSDLKAKAVIVQAGIDSPVIEVARRQGIPLLELTPVTEAAAGVFRLAGPGGARLGQGGRPIWGEPGDEALVLHTSGTTSRPKIVPLTQANICATAWHIRATLELSPADRCLNIMPLFHIHGLMAALLSSLGAGASTVCTPGFYAPRFFEWMDECRPTWYTAVPTMHQAILARAAEHRDVIARCPLRLIRSSSAALAPQVLADLEAAFGAPVIEAYGMTEAAHQMASNPLPPRQRKPGSVGVAAGPQVAIMDAQGQLLPLGQTGEVVIRGPDVTAGYENNPEANRTSFVNGWFRTGDQGYLDADGYLFLTGRLKEIINRAGEKIAPREVDEVLLAHPAVAQAVAFALPHPKLGEEVAAALVLRDGATVTETEIRLFAAERLADFKVPSRVVFLPEIPKGPSGKLQRIGLAEKLNLTAAPTPMQGQYQAPRTPLEQQLVEIWEQTLRLKRVGVRDNFFDIGGDSILAVSLFLEIGKRLGKHLPPSTLFQAATIERLAEFFSGEPASAPWSSLVTVQAGDSRPPLFCVHARGGYVFCYYSLARRLHPNQPVYGLQARGLDGKQAPHTRIEDMAADYLREVRRVQPVGPYFFAGLSFAGVVIFEMAQQLRAQRQEVALLALMDTARPGARPRLADRIASRLKRLWKHGRKAAPSPAVPPLPAILEEIERINQAASRRYVPRTYPGRVTLFRVMEQDQEWDLGADKGWGTHVTGGLEIHDVPGDHDTFHTVEANVQVLAQRLRDCLEQAQAACANPAAPQSPTAAGQRPSVASTGIATRVAAAS